MLHFLSSTLSLPLSDESPPPLQKQQVRSMGTGFSAVALLERALKIMPTETKKRMCCPLCRCAWPEEDQVSLDHIVAQLRSCRTKQLAKHVGKLEQAFNGVQARFDRRTEVSQYRMGFAHTVLDDNLHTASSYLSHRMSGCYTVLRIFRFLDARYVTAMSACCVATARHCWADSKIRAPNLRATTVRAATLHLCPQTARSLLVDPSLRSAVVRGTSGLDLVAFAKWLASADKLAELNINGAGWEKVDPGAKYLAQSLPLQRLRVLDLSHNGLTDKSVTSLAAVVTGQACSARLEVLTLELNCVTEVGFAAVLELGKGRNSQIRSWGFRHNQLGDASCKILAKVLDPEAAGAPGRLNVWDLRTNRIGFDGCKALVPVIGYMEVARLGCNPLGDAGGEHLANGLGEHLRVLDLRQAEIGEAATLALGRKLREATALQELLLSGNNIGPSGAQALAEGWAWIRSLRHVDLSGNANIGREGIDLMADELPFWQQAPFRLSLASISCEDEGAKRLASALRKNPRKGRGWTIELQNNPIGSWMKLEIARLLDEDLRPEEIYSARRK
mmetsp:Transcript_46169/g.108083  ORF Transcript_46169/g.108083 Transcript_46169/m.108083 type:complete len:560 (+) Transcript_46169:220-1899(+)